jgi:hypothetical protein
MCVGKILRASCTAMALLLLAYGVLYWQNNRPAPLPSAAIVNTSWENSVEWLMAHREQILEDHNPILWWMLGESVAITGDPRLSKLFREYREDYARNYPNDIWEVIFTPGLYRGTAFRPSVYHALDDYQQYMVYTAACSADMAEDPLIAAQNNPDFCLHGIQLTRPACTTHQLMGFRLAQRSGCGFTELDTAAVQLKRTIRNQLSLDPRVVDVYIQRVLMLVESDDRDEVSPRWLQRIVEAQLPDGSWSDEQPLVPLGGDRYLTFTRIGFGIGTPQGTFHASVQGMWLMSLLRAGSLPPPGT